MRFVSDFPSLPFILWGGREMRMQDSPKAKKRRMGLEDQGRGTCDWGRG